MYNFKSISFPFLLSFLLLSTAQSFLVVSNNGKTVPTKSVQFQKIQQSQQEEAAPNERGSIVKRFGLFDGLKGAFSNEKYDSKPNAGLKNGPEMMNVTFMPSYAEIQAVPGQPIKDVAQRAKAKIRYSCKKGECGTCEVNCNGNRVKACQAVIPLVRPSRQVTIKVLNP